jgi:phenylalanyl-tRNA synthetase beta chain
MRASHSWLRAFVPHSASPADVDRLLSSHVAIVDQVEALRADLAPIVVARVVEAARHPDSDHLWVTRVDDGTGEVLDVVCGAPNVSAGTLYPFARTGTVIPGGLKIEKRKIRGALSNGMLCSARELGLGDDHTGILALNVDVAPGTPFLDAMPVGDVRFEVDVLPNRPDLLSHIGLARELAALTGVPLRLPEELRAVAEGAAQHLALATVAGAGTTAGVEVRVENASVCPLYAAFVIRGVKVGPSPAWLRERVESVGARSISNVVDVTNYFLHGFGQPMHAFDLSRLRGPAIVVRNARAGEKLVSLDGVERALADSMLVIADAERAQAVAGVIGGQESEVTERTTDILLEVACFEPGQVRRARRALGLSTDASHRFERGTDPAEPERSGPLAAALIAFLGGGTLEQAPIIVREARAGRSPVTVRAERLSRLLGAPVTNAEIVDRLSAIGFECRPHGDAVIVTPPSWRHDVSRDVDLLEEIARLRGYDTLPDGLSAFRPSTAPDAPLHLAAARVRELLVGAGMAEVRPLPFVAGDDATHLRVTNALADDEPHLRTRILDTLARRAEYNLARREGDLRLFETGSAFRLRGAEYVEEARVAALVMGRRRPTHFTEPDPPLYDHWDAKGLALELVGEAHPTAAVELRAAAGDLLWEVVADGVVVGEVCRVPLDAPPWAAPAFGVEVTLGVLAVAPVAPPGAHLAGDTPAVRSGASDRVFRPLPTTPPAVFDLAFIVPDTVQAADVGATLRRAAGELLESLNLFDQFRGEGVPAGHRSLAWRLTFRHPSRTLNDKEIAGRRQKLISSAEREHGVVARTS